MNMRIPTLSMNRNWKRWIEQQRGRCEQNRWLDTDSQITIGTNNSWWRENRWHFNEKIIRCDLHGLNYHSCYLYWSRKKWLNSNGLLKGWLTNYLLMIRMNEPYILTLEYTFIIHNDINILEFQIEIHLKSVCNSIKYRSQRNRIREKTIIGFMMFNNNGEIYRWIIERTKNKNAEWIQP